MRYQSLAANTTCLCEGCGRRVAAENLYFPDPQAHAQLAAGNAYHFFVRHDLVSGDPQVTIDAIYNTVCSVACQVRATRQKAPRLVEEVQKVSFDAKGLRGYVRASVRD